MCVCASTKPGSSMALPKSRTSSARSLSSSSRATWTMRRPSTSSPQRCRYPVPVPSITPCPRTSILVTPSPHDQLSPVQIAVELYMHQIVEDWVAQISNQPHANALRTAGCPLNSIDSPSKHLRPVNVPAHCRLMGSELTRTTILHPSTPREFGSVSSLIHPSTSILVTSSISWLSVYSFPAGKRS